MKIKKFKNCNGTMRKVEVDADSPACGEDRCLHHDGRYFGNCAHMAAMFQFNFPCSAVSIGIPLDCDADEIKVLYIAERKLGRAACRIGAEGDGTSGIASKTQPEKDSGGKR